LLVAGLALLCACSNDTPLELRGQALGTGWYALISKLPAGVEATEVRTAIELALAEMDRLASDWRPDSELSELNSWLSTQPAGSQRGVSPELCGLLDLSEQVHRSTLGAFDPTVGELVGALGFGARARPMPLAPGPELDQIRSRLGWSKLGFDSGGCSLSPSADAAHALDLSGIAKGGGVDWAAKELRGLGIEDFLIEVGGELVLSGKSPRGDAWLQGVDRPTAGRDEPRMPALRFMATDVAVATSGDYRQWAVQDGERFSHVIDPRLGACAASRVASITVLASDCASADAYATGLMVLGVHEGQLALRGLPGIEALFLEYAPGGGFVMSCTPGFPTIELAPGFETELRGALPGQVSSKPLR
jgi:thiamine biosynthesis lipoprotein